MARPLILADWQLEAARDGRLRQVWVPAGESELTAWIGRKVCPYGQPGDELPVGERWRVEYGYDEVSACDVPEMAVDYYADTSDDWMHPGIAGQWREASAMPDWAVRKWLRLTRIRVKTLGEMTEQDARAAGHEGKWVGTDWDQRTAYHPQVLERWNAQHPEQSWRKSLVCWVLHVEAT